MDKARLNLILGIGSNLHEGEGVGITVGRAVYEKLQYPALQFLSAEKVDRRVLEEIKRAANLFIIDRVRGSNAIQGSVMSAGMDNFEQFRNVMSEETYRIMDSIKVSAKLGETVPVSVRFFGVEIGRDVRAGDTLGKTLKLMSETAVQMIAIELIQTL